MKDRVKKYNAYNRIVKVIYSCKSKDHVRFTERMITNFGKLFGDDALMWSLTHTLIPVRNKI